MSYFPTAAYAHIMGGTSIFRHHNSRVRDGNESDTVDIDLLRSSLNLVEKVFGISDENKSTIIAHLLNHAEDIGIADDFIVVEDSTTAAVWDTKFINDLPDSSFAVIEKGGKRVDGKTEPRSYRHLPYKGATGKVDLPHLRNALARMDQIEAVSPKDSTERIRKVARARLIGVAKKYLPNSKFAKEKSLFGTTAKITKVEVFEQRKIYFLTIDLPTEEGQPAMPSYMMIIEVDYNQEGKPYGVKLYDEFIPEVFITDVVDFLSNLPPA